MSAVPSAESASTTMTWSTSPLRSFSRATVARIGPMVAATLRVGKTTVVLRSRAGPAAARPANSWWLNDRWANHSRTLTLM